MTPRRKRMWIIALCVLGVGIAVALILTAFNQNLMYFYSPSEVARGEAPSNRAFRLGGMVVTGSVSRGDAKDLTVRFKVTDFVKEREIAYRGILPDLFREGQGIVAIGQLDGQGVFVASEVLAKHDENYMPPEVAQALKDGEASKAAQP
ncbi:MAG: cytochrome c maturation protein CcmE [Proteobacteria bacterium]|jgi:cytochrome c-type biogenesis protein CcmE|nr:cytochrome c maturation protein CcmE [Pseudomonadota bacterium]MBK8961244.1 cytochrome c maturation protein CcmE [Pseudomonadota bacterium]